MMMNLDKCFLLRSCRRTCPIQFTYKLFNIGLKTVSETVDLGIRYTALLEFSSHIRSMVAKANRTLGFLKRLATNFSNDQTTGLLYCALVRPHLEYASEIWAPQQATYKLLIERVQNKFLRLAACKLECKMSVMDHNYNIVSIRMRLPSLETRRTVANLLLLFKSINGIISCPQLLRSLNFYSPSKSVRHERSFLPRRYVTNFANSDTITRICSQANNYSTLIVFYSSCVYTFHNSLFNLL